MLNEFFKIVPNPDFASYTKQDKIKLVRLAYPTKASFNRVLTYDEFDPDSNEAEQKQKEMVIFSKKEDGLVKYY